MKITMVMKNCRIIGSFACYHPEQLAEALRKEGHDVAVVFDSFLFQSRCTLEGIVTKEVPSDEVVERIMSFGPDLVMFEVYAEKRIIKSGKFKISRERTLSLSL